MKEISGETTFDTTLKVNLSESNAGCLTQGFQPALLHHLVNPPRFSVLSGCANFSFSHQCYGSDFDLLSFQRINNRVNAGWDAGGQ